MAQQLLLIKGTLKAIISRSKILSRITRRVYFGLNKLDKKLIEYIDYSNGYFVELGANDGLLQSNTKHLELFKNWRGILIEPIPELAKKCVKNRKATTVNSACVSFEYSEKYIEMAYSGLMSTVLNDQNDLADPMSHAQNGAKFLAKGEVVNTLKVPAKSLEAILIESGAPRKMDLLSLDVEGFELEVLKGLDHTHFRFKWMLIESRDLEALEDFLSKLNYSLHAQLSHHDYLFEDLISRE